MLVEWSSQVSSFPCFPLSVVPVNVVSPPIPGSEGDGEADDAPGEADGGAGDSTAIGGGGGGLELYCPEIQSVEAITRITRATTATLPSAIFRERFRSGDIIE